MTDNEMAAMMGATPAANDRPEWLTKKPKGGGLTDDQMAQLMAPPSHSLDSLSADIARGKDALAASGPSLPSRLISAARNGADAVGQSFSNLGHFAAKAVPAAIDLVSLVSRTGGLQVPFGKLADPAYRHEAERGVSDVVTGGLAERAANAVDPSFAASAPSEAAANPDVRSAGGLLGMALPSPFKYAAGKAAAAVPGSGVLSSGARGVAAYEAGAVPAAAAQAPEGHRLEAAYAAATDPAGLMLSGGLPALAAAGGKATNALVSGARGRATKDIGKDIVAAEGPRARATDQKRIAEVNDRLFSLTQDNPELRDTWRKPAEKALPEIKAIKRAVAEPLDRLYDKVDQLTADTSGVPAPVRPEVSTTSGATQQMSNPNWPTTPASPEVGPTRATANHGAGGVRLGDIIDGFDAAAKQAGSKASGQAEAARFEAVKQNFIKAYGEPAFDPTMRVTKEGVTAGQMLTMLEKAKARGTPGVDEQIAHIQKIATSGVNLDKRIPTKLFREEVTDLHKNAESAMGGLEGTARNEALAKLYQTGKQIIDAHLDSSGLAPEELAQLRHANDQYFLLSRAESAIESRGWKEANKSHGLAHSIHGAVEGGSLAAAAGYGAMHPHAILPMVGTYAAVKAAPAIASRLNWRLAQRAPGAPVGTAIPGIAANASNPLLRAAEIERQRREQSAAQLGGP